MLVALMGGWFFSACVPPPSVSSAATVTATTTFEPTPTLGAEVELEVKDLQGQPVRLSDYRGKTTLITFWASWCTVCRDVMPDLEAFYRLHQDDGFVLIGVNAGEGPQEAAQYIAEQGFTFISWSDPAGNAMIRIGARGLPFSILVNAEGRRLAAWYGGVTEEFLEQATGLSVGEN